MGRLHFLSIYKILFAVYLEHCSFLTLTNVIPILNDLVYAMHCQCMFALSMCNSMTRTQTPKLLSLSLSHTHTHTLKHIHSHTQTQKKHKHTLQQVWQSADVFNHRTLSGRQSTINLPIKVACFVKK
jgi:hypothetical protein